MSVDMNSQASDSNEEDFGVNSEDEDDDEGEDEEDQGDISTYYEGVASDVEQQSADSFDPEEYLFTCLTYKESQRVLIEEVNTVAAALKAPQSLQCGVCLQIVRRDSLLALPCQHSFCKGCWEQHCTVLVKDGLGVGISCMAQDCSLQMPEDFVLPLLPGEELKDKYRRYLFRDYVESHFQLQLCPGADCPIVIKVEEPRARRVQCIRCREVFCFKCRQLYHAPTDCATIRRWLTKCADDSETANYISAHTKDQCSKCKHDFCWMCLGDWKTHGSEYYECSRYKENPDIVNQSQQAQAREALKKYLFYFERWENHNKSLQLEVQTYQRIQEKIQERVMNNLGTWIDWQYLHNASRLLAKCRYTLQYTYPYAYYMESGSRKKLFEYQQAQLEAEIENLSWKVERADSYERGVVGVEGELTASDRGDLENQMHIAEKKRRTLLNGFQDT
ncbi:E3 ubiquitin-protein ligase ARIH2 [Liparis tanakae]|uniref:RBR-type E3 ubiquitin transferase n=1 Tax=Liparis tanakae TaxID=230148 RepID=A0A4Z2HFR3_9TELE|nr:E3 ubiquitin-protein ligase ARIH2 [Liparis tanakae]